MLIYKLIQKKIDMIYVLDIYKINLNGKIIKRRVKIQTSYYNDEIRKAALCSPNFIKFIL